MKGVLENNIEGFEREMRACFESLSGSCHGEERLKPLRDSCRLRGVVPEEISSATCSIQGFLRDGLISTFSFITFGSLGG